MCKFSFAYDLEACECMGNAKLCCDKCLCLDVCMHSECVKSFLVGNWNCLQYLLHWILTLIILIPNFNSNRYVQQKSRSMQTLPWEISIIDYYEQIEVHKKGQIEKWHILGMVMTLQGLGKCCINVCYYGNTGVYCYLSDALGPLR